MAKKRNARHWDEPQYHADHPRPVTRRQFVAQGFMTGAAYTTGAGILSLPDRDGWRGQDSVHRL